MQWSMIDASDERVSIERASYVEWYWPAIDRSIYLTLRFLGIPSEIGLYMCALKGKQITTPQTPLGFEPNIIIYLNWSNNPITRDAPAESGEHFAGRTKTQMLFGKTAARVSNQEPVGLGTWISGDKGVSRKQTTTPPLGQTPLPPEVQVPSPTGYAN
jgi:hypothetical protein